MTTTEALIPATEQTEIAPQPARRMWSRFRRSAIGWVGLVLLVLLVLYAILGPELVGGFDAATRINSANAFAPPFADGSIFGTDHLGRDLFGLAALGLRSSIIIALVVVACSAFVGWFLGAVSGYVGGKLDDVLGRIMDVFNAFPGILVALAIVTAVGPSLPVVAVVLIAVTWVLYARVSRAEVLQLKNVAFVEAAQLSGSGFTAILFKHLGRSTWPMVLSLAVIEIPHVILTEATLSFLGFGIKPPNVSLGYMISDERNYLVVSPWPITLTGTLLVLTCVSFALIGIAIRRALGRED